MFHAFSQEFNLINKGFLFLERLQKILPEEKPLEDFFVLVCRIFETLEKENEQIFMIYLRMQTLIFSGLMPRFDLVREDTHFENILGLGLQRIIHSSNFFVFFSGLKYCTLDVSLGGILLPR